MRSLQRVTELERRGTPLAGGRENYTRDMSRLAEIPFTYGLAVMGIAVSSLVALYWSWTQGWLPGLSGRSERRHHHGSGRGLDHGSREQEAPQESAEFRAASAHHPSEIPHHGSQHHGSQWHSEASEGWSPEIGRDEDETDSRWHAVPEADMPEDPPAERHAEAISYEPDADEIEPEAFEFEPEPSRMEHEPRVADEVEAPVSRDPAETFADRRGFDNDAPPEPAEDDDFLYTTEVASEPVGEELTPTSADPPVEGAKRAETQAKSDRARRKTAKPKGADAKPGTAAGTKPVTVRKPKKADAIAPAVADDLTRIVGIGPTIARQLGDMGITRFDQLARLGSDELDRIDATLKFRGRSRRERWVEQAVTLGGIESKPAHKVKARAGTKKPK